MISNWTQYVAERERILSDVDFILDWVTRACGVDAQALLGKSRTTRVSTARKLASALLLDCCGCSLSEAGRVLGKHHTSVRTAAIGGRKHPLYADGKAFHQRHFCTP